VARYMITTTLLCLARWHPPAVVRDPKA